MSAAGAYRLHEGAATVDALAAVRDYAMKPYVDIDAAGFGGRREPDGHWTDPIVGVLEYAQRIVSTPGMRDGLYWAALAGEAESPLGPLFGDDQPGDGYNGYRFRVLKAQGPNARGGAYDYRIKGRMTAGFALVAWPVRYGDTGIMTFVLSHDGRLLEKDLGPGTDAAARAMRRFDPDTSWQAVAP